jgi:hemolysin III
LAAALAACGAGAFMGRAARVRGLALPPILAFCGGMIACYAASATYHAIPLADPALDVFRLIDHTGVYVLIAGTDTPVVYYLLRPGRFRRYLLGSLWGLAMGGILSTWLVSGLPYWSIVLPYIALGWIAVVPLPLLVRAIGWRQLAWLLAGGLLYTTGAVIDWLGPQRSVGEAFGAHEVFHLLTIGGSLCHAVFIGRFVMRYVHPPVGD